MTIALFASLDARAELPPGAGMTLYEITNNLENTLGWYAVIGSSNVTAFGYTWEADTAYWFWTSGSPFPSSFRIYWYSSSAPNRDPSTADAHLTTGAFDTSQTYTPVTSGNWWTVTRYIDGTTADDLGWLRNINDDQVWWEYDADNYLAIDSNDYLQFTSTGSPPTDPHYRCIDLGL